MEHHGEVKVLLDADVDGLFGELPGLRLGSGSGVGQDDPVMLPLVIIAMLFLHLVSPAGSATAHTAESRAIRGSSPCRDRQGSGATATPADGGDCGSAPKPFSTPLMGFEPGGNVVAYDGWYYVPVKLGTEPRIRMARFRSLAAMSVLKDERSLRSQRVVWDGAGSPASGFINWPVAMYRLRGKWFIYMDASRRNPPNFTDRLYALESDTDNPMGGWTLKGRVGQDTWTIGFCPFVWQGRLYMVVSNREHHTPGTHQALAIAGMRNPWTTTSDWISLTDPTYGWEKWSIKGPGTAPINEVDQPLIHNGKLHVIFSASHVNSPHYAAGWLTYDGAGSLTDRRNWTKHSRPILSRTTRTAGPGQTFVFTSLDGSVDYLGYAYWRTPGIQAPRPIGVTPIRWDANDDPIVNPPPDPGTRFLEPAAPDQRTAARP